MAHVAQALPERYSPLRLLCRFERPTSKAFRKAAIYQPRERPLHPRSCVDVLNEGRPPCYPTEGESAVGKESKATPNHIPFVCHHPYCSKAISEPLIDERRKKPPRR